MQMSCLRLKIKGGHKCSSGDAHNKEKRKIELYKAGCFFACFLKQLLGTRQLCGCVPGASRSQSAFTDGY